MVKQGIIPDELTKPFFDAANDERLVMPDVKTKTRIKRARSSSKKRSSRKKSDD